MLSAQQAQLSIRQWLEVTETQPLSLTVTQSEISQCRRSPRTMESVLLGFTPGLLSYHPQPTLHQLRAGTVRHGLTQLDGDLYHLPGLHQGSQASASRV